MENDLKVTTFAYTTNIYNYAARLRSMGHSSLGERLVTATLDTQYYSVFTGYSFNSEKFIDNLINGYNSACKVNELLKLILAMGIDMKEEKVLMEGIDKIIRLYGASLSTIRKKYQINQSEPIESQKFEFPDESEIESGELKAIPMPDGDVLVEDIKKEDDNSEDNND